MTRRNTCSRFAGALVAGALTFASGRADAYEHQWHVSLSAGYSALLDETVSVNGFGGGVSLAYGINDAINLMADVRSAAYPTVGLVVPSAGAGFAYVIDVLEWVPYAGALAGVADEWTTGPCDNGVAPACHAFKLMFEFPFGLDYVVSRRVEVGIAGHYQILLLNGGGVGNVLGAFAKVGFTWGY